MSGSAMRVIIYDEETCDSLDLGRVADEVQAIAGYRADLRGEFVAYWVGATVEDRGAAGARLAEDYPEALAAVLVGARVVDPMSRQQPEREPLPVERSAEWRALGKAGRTSKGILYDGAQAQWAFSELMGEGAGDACHVILTGRLLGTWMPSDGRWHAHTGIYGQPTLISTSGLVQAPARPREYYQGQAMASTRMAPREVVEAALQAEMGDRMLLSDDARITSCVTGHILQAIHFHQTGEAFCPEPTCRLFNARRQEELLRAQCSEESALCPRHRAFFSALEAGTHE